MIEHRLQAMRRELRVKELKVLDAARQRFLEHQQSTKEAEVRRLDDEIRKKVVRRDVETKALLEDIELRALELEARKTALEQDLERTQHETVYRLRADHEAEVHRMELERDVLDGEVDGAGEEEKEGVADADARLARVQAHEAATRALREAGARREERSRGERGRCEEVGWWEVWGDGEGNSCVEMLSSCWIGCGEGRGELDKAGGVSEAD